MKIDEIKIDWRDFSRHAKEQEDANLVYDVIVASPRLGSYKEAVNLPYREARNKMIDLADSHFADIFREDPRNSEKEWQNYDAIKVSNSTLGAVTFYYLRDASKKQ